MSLHHLTYRKYETHWRERKLRVHPPICTAVKLCILFFHHAALPVSDEDLQQLCGGRANLGMVGCVLRKRLVALRHWVEAERSHIQQVRRSMRTSAGLTKES